LQIKGVILFCPTAVTPAKLLLRLLLLLLLLRLLLLR
jgi:hypothetical protein